MMQNRCGFSLVELAVSVTVIGLLLAVVVKGGEMIENARISSTILQAKTFETAIDGFRSDYKAWPGDFLRAVEYIEDCTNAVDCQNGDGSGVVSIDAANNPAAFASGLASIESRQVWKHLVYSGYGAGLPIGDDDAYGSRYPAASIGGGFEMYFDSDLNEDGITVQNGHFLRLSGTLSVDPLEDGQGVDGRAVFIMDRKMDNGNILSGDLVAAGIDGDCGETDAGNCLVFIGVGQ